MSFLKVTILIFLLTSSPLFCLGQDKPISEQPDQQSEPSLEKPKPQFEIGAYVGAPAIINFRVGWWNIFESELALRISGFFSSDDFYGYDGEIAWSFDQVGVFHQYLALSAGKWNLDLLGDDPTPLASYYSYPSYGFYLSNFLSIQGGLMFFSNQGSIRFFPMVKAGLGFRF